MKAAAAPGLPASGPPPARLLTPRVVPLPAPPRWTGRVLAGAALVAVVFSFFASDLADLAFFAVVVVGFRLGVWAERLAYLWLARTGPFFRLLGVFCLPALGIALFVVGGLGADALGVVDRVFYAEDEGALGSLWIALTLPAGLWIMGASLGSISVTLIDVVVSALVKSFRARITLAVLFLVGVLAAPVSAVVWLGEYMRRRVEQGLEPTEGWNVNAEGEGADWLLQAGEWFLEHPWAVTLTATAVGLLLGLPAIISACSKLADAVLERITPLMHAFDAVASGEREVRVEEAGSTELTELARHFNRMIDRVAFGEQMERAFGAYVGDHLLDQIRAQRGEAQLPAETKDASVYFADIRGFTTMSEQLPPEAVVEVLNRYFTTVVDVIDRHEGYLDKFIGDAVVVVFNGPLHQPGHAARCVRCAVAMLAAVRALNEEGAFPEVGQLRVGAGVNSGPMVCGNIGSARQMEYTVIGDAVNLASRVEGMTKLYGAPVLITEATVERLGEDHGFTLREVDKVAVKGKAAPVRLYEVLEGHGPEQWGLRSQTLEAFSAALAAYQRGDAEEARAGFEEVLARNPGDEAARLMADRALPLVEDGVPKGWDGTARMSTK